MTIPPPGQDRTTLLRAYEKLRGSADPGLSLGVWSGQGDWATFSPAYRDRQGRRALAELDQLIADLTAFRGELAAAVDR